MMKKVYLVFADGTINEITEEFNHADVHNKYSFYQLCEDFQNMTGGELSFVEEEL
jgi:hypothetical protein